MPTYVEIDLDRPRKLSYRFSDVHDLCRRLGNISIIGLAKQAEALDPAALVSLLEFGFRHEDRKLSYERAKELVDMYIERGGLLRDLINKIVAALMAGLGLEDTGEKA